MSDNDPDTNLQDPAWDEDVLRSRGRVADHWKRFFAILVGFAITVAVMRAYACVLGHEWAGVFCFVALVFTLPPIFLGMERSLDLRYLQRTNDIPSKGIVAIDTAVLFLTGLAFMTLAVSIPDPSQSTSLWAQRAPDLEWAFIVIIAAFFLSDALVLLVIGIRLAGQSKSVAAGHYLLAILNFIAGALCLLGLLAPSRVFIVTPYRFWIVALVSIIRTVLDYTVTGDEFLFPKARLKETRSGSI